MRGRIFQKLFILEMPLRVQVQGESAWLMIEVVISRVRCRLPRNANEHEQLHEPLRRRKVLLT